MKTMALVALLALNFNAVAFTTLNVTKYQGYGISGSLICESVASCYQHILSAEYRNLTKYCKYVNIVHNGRVVWFRDYNTPYWKAKQKQQ